MARALVATKMLTLVGHVLGRTYTSATTCTSVLGTQTLLAHK